MAESSAGTLEVEAADVVKVVLQFLKENALTDSLRVLQEESQVALNTVDDVDVFISDVRAPPSLAHALRPSRVAREPRCRHRRCSTGDGTP